MATLEEIGAEMERFRKALPDLLRTCPGKWVVFKAGRVVSTHDDEEAAYAAGIEAFGRDGGQIVVCVEEERIYALGGIASLTK